jgi:hypothetical protein
LPTLGDRLLPRTEGEEGGERGPAEELNGESALLSRAEDVAIDDGGSGRGGRCLRAMALEDGVASLTTSYVLRKR